MRLSVTCDPALRYPDGDDSFSPSESYPEYRLGHRSERPNDVYRAVRRTLQQMGLDALRFGSPDWNPLGEFVTPGQKVFVLCNFVQHRRPNEPAEVFSAKCTHGSVVRAVIDYLLIAGAEVEFGNAPVQSCNWDAVLAETGAARVETFYASRRLPVRSRDLRMLVAERDAMGNVARSVTRDAADVVEIDLGSTSLLDGASQHGARYRVQDYDPRRTEAFHAPGRHVYVVHRAVLEADLIFSIPKLKTHEKVGVTCAVKGCVGAVGHKDCLAHHRFGPPAQGGDEYPSDPLGLFRTASRLHDLVYRRSPRIGILTVADTWLRRIMRRLNPSVAGAWWGNDTAWRMGADLARIVEHATPGGMQQHAVRRHVALVDGVVGGEGQGPLRPSAVASGVLFFADDAYLADFAAALLMGFDPMRVPHLRHGWQGGLATTVTVNGRDSELDRLPGLVAPFQPPPGWKGHL